MTVILDGIILPKDMVWVDEFVWSPVIQSVEVGLNGSLIVQRAVQTNGRPITLRSSDGPAWISRATLLALQAKRAIPNHIMFLTLRNLYFPQVIFRHPDGLIAEPILAKCEPGEDDLYFVTIQLMTI